MKLTDFYNAVSRRVDTDKTSISVAETKRVLSEAFLELASMDAAEFADHERHPHVAAGGTGTIPRGQGQSTRAREEIHPALLEADGILVIIMVITHTGI